MLNKLIGPRFRVHYWSCSKFADWCIVTFGDPLYKKPFCATMEEWQAWKELYSVNCPKTYWFTEIFLSKAQNFLYYPYDVCKAIKHYIVNRFVNKTHIVELSLPKGQWVEYDVRLVFAMFALLEEFVENDTSAEKLMVAIKYNPESKYQEVLNLYYDWQERKKEVYADAEQDRELARRLVEVMDHLWW